MVNKGNGDRGDGKGKRKWVYVIREDMNQECEVDWGNYDGYVEGKNVVVWVKSEC